VASLRVSRVPVWDDSKSGLGDANAFATYLFDTGNPRVSLGAGPLFGFPTATDDALGTDQKLYTANNDRIEVLMRHCRPLAG
jgi:hypothetical protein